MIQDIPQAPAAEPQNIETVFICGLDATITEKELQELIKFTIGSTPAVQINKLMAGGQERLLAEVKCKLEDAQVLHIKLNNTQLKNCFLKLMPQACMKSLVISNLPKVFSEKDLFIILNQLTPSSLKRVILADNPEIVGETLGVALAIYQNFEQATKALKALKQQGEILKSKIDVCWKEPDFDVIKELSNQTRVLCVKNISVSTDTGRIRDTFQAFGPVVRIQRYATEAFVEFLNVDNAKQALAALNDKRFEAGLVWHIYPAKKIDPELAQVNADKNKTFSKNFLAEDDQQALRKFLYNGQLPSIEPKVAQTAVNIVQQIQKSQSDKAQLLNLQAENLRMISGQNGNPNGNPGNPAGGNNNNNNNNNPKQGNQGNQGNQNNQNQNQNNINNNNFNQNQNNMNFNNMNGMNGMNNNPNNINNLNNNMGGMMNTGFPAGGNFNNSNTGINQNTFNNANTGIATDMNIGNPVNFTANNNIPNQQLQAGNIGNVINQNLGQTPIGASTFIPQGINQAQSGIAQPNGNQFWVAN